MSGTTELCSLIQVIWLSTETRIRVKLKTHFVKFQMHCLPGKQWRTFEHILGNKWIRERKYFISRICVLSLGMKRYNNSVAGKCSMIENTNTQRGETSFESSNRAILLERRKSKLREPGVISKRKIRGTSRRCVSLRSTFNYFPRYRWNLRETILLCGTFALLASKQRKESRSPFLKTITATTQFNCLLCPIVLHSLHSGSTRQSLCC